MCKRKNFDSTDGNGIPDYSIRHVFSPQEKRNIISVCDSAFMESIMQRTDFPSLFKKIDNFAEFIVAYNTEILGYAAVYTNNISDRTAYISLIAVRPEFQGKRIGYDLLNACIESAAKHNMKQIKLEVLRSNTNAIQFYKRNDFYYLESCSNNSIYMYRNIE